MNDTSIVDMALNIFKFIIDLAGDLVFGWTWKF